MGQNGGGFHLRAQRGLLCSVPQVCPTLCDRMDCSTPGSACGILQAKYWVAIASSRGSSGNKPASLASPVSQAGSLLPCHWGSPKGRFHKDSPVGARRLRQQAPWKDSGVNPLGLKQGEVGRFLCKMASILISCLTPASDSSFPCHLRPQDMSLSPAKIKLKMVKVSHEAEQQRMLWPSTHGALEPPELPPEKQGIWRFFSGNRVAPGEALQHRHLEVPRQRP